MKLSKAYNAKKVNFFLREWAGVYLCFVRVCVCVLACARHFVCVRARACCCQEMVAAEYSWRLRSVGAER